MGVPFQVTEFDSPSYRIWADNLSIAEPSVARNRMTLPIAEATGSIWMLETRTNDFVPVTSGSEWNQVPAPRENFAASDDEIKDRNP